MKNAVIILLLVITAEIIFGSGYAADEQKEKKVDPIQQAFLDFKSKVKYGEKVDINLFDVYRVVDVRMTKYKVKLPETERFMCVVWVEEWRHDKAEPVIRHSEAFAFKRHDHWYSESFMISLPTESTDYYTFFFGFSSERFKDKSAEFEWPHVFVTRFPETLSLPPKETITVAFEGKFTLGVPVPKNNDPDECFKELLASVKKDSKYSFALVKLTLIPVKDREEEKSIEKMAPVFIDGKFVLDGLQPSQNTPDVF